MLPVFFFLLALLLPKTAQAASCPNVPVLFYHHIQPPAEAKAKKQQSLSVDNAAFEKQLSYLNAHNYQTITLDQLDTILTSGNSSFSKPIVLTIDDGYSDVYDYAYPLAKKYNIKLNLFIPTGLLENKNYLSWQQLKDMKDSGNISVYNHTWSHQNFGNKTTLEKIDWELTTSEKQLEEHLGSVTKMFAYPYGTISKKAIDKVQSLGFKLAFTISRGVVNCKSTRLQLPRIRIGNAPLSSYGI